MMLIGLTGGIGSGKTTVADLFKRYGIPVYESDTRAKALMETDPVLKEKIIELLGGEAYLPDLRLNRSWIASQVFNNEEMLDRLNSMVHPAVFDDLKKWAILPDQMHAPYLIQESALLFEENLTSRFTAVILVTAEEATRISRVMKRDNVTKEKVIQRMQHQWTDDKKIPMSDYVIFNDHDRSLDKQVNDIDLMIKSRPTNV